MQSNSGTVVATVKSGYLELDEDTPLLDWQNYLDERDFQSENVCAEFLLVKNGPAGLVLLLEALSDCNLTSICSDIDLEQASSFLGKLNTSL